MQQRDDDSVPSGDTGTDRPAEPDLDPRRQGLKRIDVCGLLDGDREVVLVFRGADYRLRVTSNEKLILTK